MKTCIKHLHILHVSNTSYMLKSCILNIQGYIEVMFIEVMHIEVMYIEVMYIEVMHIEIMHIY